MSAAVLLLGGRSGIGLAIVEELLRRGAAGPRPVVVLAQRGRRDGDQAAREALLAAGAGDVEVVAFDAEALDAHAELVDRVFARHEVTHAVVAFGLLGDQEQAWQDVAAAQRLVGVNATAAIGLGVALASRMREQGSGTIVALSSVAGVRVRRSNFVYGASKAAMDAFYLNLAVALEDSGVRVLVVRPGAVATRMIEGNDPVALTVSPQRVARAACDALQSGRELVHVPRVFAPAMAAAHLVPRRLWRRLRS